MVRGMLHSLSAALLGLSWTVAGTAVYAQNATGVIEGTILDPSKAIIRNAVVVVTQGDTGWGVTVLSNEFGFYTVRSLAPGSYSVRVEVPGFARTILTGIMVETGAVGNGTVTMPLASTEGAAEVTTSAVAVDTIRHTVDTVIHETEIRDLPITSRNALDLASLAPGVVVNSGASLDPTKVLGYRAIGISGRFGAGTRVQVDGIEINDYLVGSTVLNLPPDAIHEFQVTRSSNDVSTPMTSTGVVSINMKSGTNVFHGRAFSDYANQALSARPSYLTSVLPYQQERGGVSIGGPIRKNKLFWFGGWEKTALETTWQNPSSLFPQINDTENVPTSIRYVYGHADWNLGPGIHAFYGLLHEGNRTTGGTLTQPYSTVDWSTGHTAGVDLTGARWSHSIRFGFVNFNNRIVSTEFNIHAPLTPQGQRYVLVVGPYRVGPNGASPQATGESTMQFSYDGSRIWGRHVLRYGGRLNLVTTSGFIGEARLSVTGQYNNATVAEVQARGGNPADPGEYPISAFQMTTGRTYYASLSGHGFPYGAVHNNRLSGHAEDSAKIGRRLNINLGVRWEYDTAYFGNGQLARDPALENWVAGASQHPHMPRNLFSPSAGFAWDVTGHGKTVIRGGFLKAYEAAIHENNDEPAMLPASYGATRFSDSLVVRPDGTPIDADGRHPNGSYHDLVGMRLEDAMPLLGSLYDQMRKSWGSAKLDPRGTSAFRLARGFSVAVYPGNQYKIPYSLQFNLGVQREIVRGTVMTADYVVNHGVGLPLLQPDLEHRLDAGTLDTGAAKAQMTSVLAGKTVDDWIAANPSRPIAPLGLMSDTIWPGVTPDYLQARFVQGGFSRYRALQVSLRRQRGTLGPLRDTYYQVAYALARSEASDTSTLAELYYYGNVLDNRNWNGRETFGPTSQDQTHRFTTITNFTVRGGLRLGTVWTFRTPAPQSLRIPILSSTLTGFNSLLAGDLNGDAVVDLLPGLGAGQFGRKVKHLRELNLVIQNFNDNYTGKPTAHGQALVNAGILTQEQLTRLGGVISPIPLVPVSNPNPWHNVFTTNVMIQRPISFEKVHFGPFVQVFNLFNHAPSGAYSPSLNQTFGSLNFDYANAPPGFQESDLNRSVRFRNASPRSLQFGIRVDF